MPDGDFDIQMVAVDSLIPYSNNPKEHPDAQVKKIASSIKNYGWDQPVVVDGDNEIIKGHGRTQAAELLGLEQVPVIKRQDLSDAEAKAARIADNKTAESDWINDSLESELAVLQDFDDINMSSLGFDDDELEDLLDDAGDTSELPGLSDEPLADKQLEDVSILNLYAGIGGNRRLWGDKPDVTAVEYNQEIADAYADFNPDDTVVVGDAHEYLLENFADFDVIWSSPPCPTHSKMRKNFSVNVGADPVFPDLKLYEEILFLKGYFTGKWVVENVDPWYEPLIDGKKTDRHLFWSNFDIPKTKVERNAVLTAEEFDIEAHQETFGFDLSEYTFSSDYGKKKILKNCVHPEVGKTILESAMQSDIQA
jgi:DNA (cytosine-5)-methyltransferase 1